MRGLTGPCARVIVTLMVNDAAAKQRLTGYQAQDGLLVQGTMMRQLSVDTYGFSGTHQFCLQGEQ